MALDILTNRSFQSYVAPTLANAPQTNSQTTNLNTFTDIPLPFPPPSWGRVMEGVKSNHPLMARMFNFATIDEKGGDDGYVKTGVFAGALVLLGMAYLLTRNLGKDEKLTAGIKAPPEADPKAAPTGKEQESASKAFASEHLKAYVDDFLRTYPRYSSYARSIIETQVGELLAWWFKMPVDYRYRIAKGHSSGKEISNEDLKLPSHPWLNEYAARLFVSREAPPAISRTRTGDEGLSREERARLRASEGPGETGPAATDGIELDELRARAFFKDLFQPLTDLPRQNPNAGDFMARVQALIGKNGVIDSAMQDKKTATSPSLLGEAAVQQPPRMDGPDQPLFKVRLQPPVDLTVEYIRNDKPYIYRAEGDGQAQIDAGEILASNSLIVISQAYDPDGRPVAKNNRAKGNVYEEYEVRLYYDAEGRLMDTTLRRRKIRLEPSPDAELLLVPQLINSRLLTAMSGLSTRWSEGLGQNLYQALHPAIKTPQNIPRGFYSLNDLRERLTEVLGKPKTSTSEPWGVFPENEWRGPDGPRQAALYDFGDSTVWRDGRPPRFSLANHAEVYGKMEEGLEQYRNPNLRYEVIVYSPVLIDNEGKVAEGELDPSKRYYEYERRFLFNAKGEPLGIMDIETPHARDFGPRAAGQPMFPRVKDSARLARFSPPKERPELDELDDLTMAGRGRRVSNQLFEELLERMKERSQNEVDALVDAILKENPELKKHPDIDRTKLEAAVTAADVEWNATPPDINKVTQGLLRTRKGRGVPKDRIDRAMGLINEWMKNRALELLFPKPIMTLMSRMANGLSIFTSGDHVGLFAHEISERHKGVDPAALKSELAGLVKKWSRMPVAEKMDILNAELKAAGKPELTQEEAATTISFKWVKDQLNGRPFLFAATRHGFLDFFRRRVRIEGERAAMFVPRSRFHPAVLDNYGDIKIFYSVDELLKSSLGDTTLEETPDPRTTERNVFRYTNAAGQIIVVIRSGLFDTKGRPVNGSIAGFVNGGVRLPSGEYHETEVRYTFAKRDHFVGLELVKNTLQTWKPGLVDRVHRDRFAAFRTPGEALPMAAAKDFVRNVILNQFLGQRVDAGSELGHGDISKAEGMATALLQKDPLLGTRPDDDKRILERLTASSGKEAAKATRQIGPGEAINARLGGANIDGILATVKDHVARELEAEAIEVEKRDVAVGRPEEHISMPLAEGEATILPPMESPAEPAAGPLVPTRTIARFKDLISEAMRRFRTGELEPAYNAFVDLAEAIEKMPEGRDRSPVARLLGWLRSAAHEAAGDMTILMQRPGRTPHYDMALSIMNRIWPEDFAAHFERIHEVTNGGADRETLVRDIWREVGSDWLFKGPIAALDTLDGGTITADEMARPAVDVSAPELGAAKAEARTKELLRTRREILDARREALDAAKKGREK